MSDKIDDKMNENASIKNGMRSTGCMTWGLLFVSLSLNAFLLTGCISPYEKRLKELAGEPCEGSFKNPFSSSTADAYRLKLKVLEEQRKNAEGSDDNAAYRKGYNEGAKEGRQEAQKNCIDRLKGIAQLNVVDESEDALDKTIEVIKQRINDLEKGQGEDAERPKRLMRDIATKLGIRVNKNMGLNDMHSRIVGVVDADMNVPKPIPENEINAALEETSWGKAFGDYHEFVKQLNGRRVIIVPASSRGSSPQ